MSAQFRPQAAANSFGQPPPQNFGGNYQPQYHFNNNNSSSNSSEDILESFNEKFKSYSSKVEDLVDAYSGPIKPYLPAISRFLMVAAFYEDATRIITQWSDQIFYLNTYRYIPHIIVVLFLLLNFIVMIAFTMLIGRKRPDVSTCVLIAVVISQCLFYVVVFFVKILGLVKYFLLFSSLADKLEDLFDYTVRGMARQ